MNFHNFAKFVIAQIIGVLLFTVIAAGQSLQGDKAVAELKKNGQYDSLMDAVRSARGDKDAVEPHPDDAIGQSAKLLASDGAASDRFGFSVAISGETLIFIRLTRENTESGPHNCTFNCTD